MMYEYQKSNRYFAQIPGSLEDIGIKELQDLGATDISKEYRGAYFSADKETLYRINYHSAIVQRVLAPLIKFNCHSDKYLYKRASEIDWTKFLSLEQTFAIFAKVNNSRIKHSQFASLRLKDAIVDQFRNKFGRRPSIDTKSPDLWINLFINNNFAVINIDTSGGALHKRKYRQKAVKAPMQETLAAAMIKESGWQGEKKLYDPFCGSGTILAEALLHCTHTPPAALRNDFGFMKLPDYDENIFRKLVKSADENIVPLPKNLIFGSDISAKAISIARQNLQNLKFGEQINLSHNSFDEIPEIKDSIIVCNPPFGVRMGDDAQIKKIYKNFGDFLKQKCTGSTAYIYFGNRKLIKSIGLKPSWKKVMINGALDGRLVKLELY